MNLKFTFILWGAVLAPPPAGAEVILSEAAALARAFPGGAPERRTLYLSPEQVKAVEEQAHSRLPSAIVTTFRGQSPAGGAQVAILDTHLVRTMPETVMVVVADAKLRMALVLQFGEPPDYLPQEGWLTLELTEDLTVW